MSGGVPAGWVLVPEAMTQEMQDAWRNSPGLSCQVAWQAALAATPTPPIEGRDADVERETAFLVALAEHGISPDVQELLVAGDGRGTVAPGALRKALRAALQALGERP